MTQAKAKKFRRDVTVDLFVQWAYQDEKIDLVCERGGGMYAQELAAAGIDVRRSSGGVYQGVRVDFSNTACNAAHPDAEFLHDLLKSRSFTAYERGFLFDYAKTGLYPDPMVGATPRLAPKYDGKGRIVTICGSDKKPKVCLVDVQVSARTIETMRGFYADWYAAMTKLTGLLWAADASLTTFNILPMGYLEKPWLNRVDVPQKT